MEEIVQSCENCGKSYNTGMNQHVKSRIERLRDLKQLRTRRGLKQIQFATNTRALWEWCQKDMKIIRL